MQPAKWLTLTKKNPHAVALELGLKPLTVWRHFHGRRHPDPNAIKRYEEYTEGAITAEDWISLWNEPECVAARAAEDAKRLERKARKERREAQQRTRQTRASAAEPVAATG